MRRVELEDIPYDQKRRVLGGWPVYRVLICDDQGHVMVDHKRNGEVRGWAVFGWMRNHPRRKGLA